MSPLASDSGCFESVPPASLSTLRGLLLPPPALERSESPLLLASQDLSIHTHGPQTKRQSLRGGHLGARAERALNRITLLVLGVLPTAGSKLARTLLRPAANIPCTLQIRPFPLDRLSIKQFLFLEPRHRRRTEEASRKRSARPVRQTTHQPATNSLSQERLPNS